MRNKLLGFFSALALMGAPGAFAQPAGQQQPASEAAQPSSQDDAQNPESINVGPMDHGAQETPSNEGINKAPGSAAGGFGSGSPYAAPPSRRSGTGGSGSSGSEEGQGKADVTVEQGTSDSADQGGTGGSGSSSSSNVSGAQGRSASAQAGQQELSGTVVKSDKKALYLRSDEGAIISFKVDKNTQFSDPSLKSAKDLKEGQQVRTSFQTEKTDNVATRVELSGRGGAGDVGRSSQDLGGSTSGSKDSGRLESGSPSHAR